MTMLKYLDRVSNIISRNFFLKIQFGNNVIDIDKLQSLSLHTKLLE